MIWLIAKGRSDATEISRLRATGKASADHAERRKIAEQIAARGGGTTDEELLEWLKGPPSPPSPS